MHSYCGEKNVKRGAVKRDATGNIVETRYYVGGYEVYRKEVNGSLDLERKTVNVSDDQKVFARVEQETGKNEVVRYQYDNHLGSACLELDQQGLIISYEEYHPFGTTSYRSGKSETEVSLKRYKYCGKERDEETGLYYYGMRYYAAWLCRFVSVDPMAHKYPSWNPYSYCLNNPIKMIDPNGEKVELITHYKKDANGNNTDQIERYELNITGKIINKSGKNIDMEKARDKIVNQIESSFQGQTKEGIPIPTTANFTVVESMDDVLASDHLFVFSRMTDGGMGMGTPRGAVNDIGGRVAFVDADYFKGPIDGTVGTMGARVATHEMGHLLGLRHTRFGLMQGNSYLRSDMNVSSGQLSSIVASLTWGKSINPINKGASKYGNMPVTGNVGRFIKYR